jgi:NitT/TauT family transport system substrate-binding protein
MIFKKAATILFCIMEFGFLISCSPKQPDKVRIGYLPVFSNLPIFVAVEQKFFQQEGLSVELVRFESSTNLASALANNDIDMAGNVAYPTVLSVESRDPGYLKIYLVSAHTEKDYLSSIITMPNSGIKKVEDLKGKTVGIFPGPSANVFFGLLFKKHGLDPKTDINLVELPANLELEALSSGKIDALATFEPTTTQVIFQLGAVNILPAAIETEVISPWHGGASVISSDYLSNNPNAAIRIVDAIYQAVDFIRKDPARAKESISIYTGIPADTAQKLPDPAFQKIDEMNFQTLQQQADMIFEGGVISHYIDIKQMIMKR